MKIIDKTNIIVGLGYFDLPLKWIFHKNYMPMLGFDIDVKKVENLKGGIFEVLPACEHAEYTDTKSIEWNKTIVSGFHTILMYGNHSIINYEKIVEWEEYM